VAPPAVASGHPAPSGAIMHGGAIGPVAGVLMGADTESFLHGVAQLDAGQVHDLAEVDGELTATVHAERRQAVRLGPQGPSCGCPQGRARGAACEHAVAVALAQLHRVTGTVVNDLVAAWFSGTLADHLPAPAPSTPPAIMHTGATPARAPATAIVHAGATSDSVARFVGSLDAAQARGLLLALGHDLPDVGEILADLAGAGRDAGARPDADGGREAARTGSRLDPARLRRWRQALTSRLAVPGYVGWDEAASYAADVQAVGGELDALLDDGHAEDARLLVEHALALLDRALGSADDSDGDIGSQLDGLLELHLAATGACAEAGCLDQVALGEWLASMAAGEGFVHPDLDGYLDPLGPAGITALRAGLLAEVGDDRDGDGARGPWQVRHTLERLAILSGTVQDVVAAVGPLSCAERYVRLVELLTELGRTADAGDRAVRGLADHGDDPRGLLADTAVAHLRAAGDHDAALATRRKVLRAHPDQARFGSLRALALELDGWARERAGAFRAVAKAPVQTRIACLLADDDPDRAWTLAHSKTGAVLGDRDWLQLCDVHAAHRPVDTLPVYERIARSMLRPASPAAYSCGVAVLESMRRAARAAGTPQVAERLVAELAETYARRPRFLDELRRARLISRR
jgi:hypothetical protein